MPTLPKRLVRSQGARDATPDRVVASLGILYALLSDDSLDAARAYGTLAQATLSRRRRAASLGEPAANHQLDHTVKPARQPVSRPLRKMSSRPRQQITRRAAMCNRAHLRMWHHPVEIICDVLVFFGRGRKARALISNRIRTKKVHRCRKPQYVGFSCAPAQLSASWKVHA